MAKTKTSDVDKPTVVEDVPEPRRADQPMLQTWPPIDDQTAVPPTGVVASSPVTADHRDRSRSSSSSTS